MVALGSSCARGLVSANVRLRPLPTLPAVHIARSQLQLFESMSARFGSSQLSPGARAWASRIPRSLSRRLPLLRIEMDHIHGISKDFSDNGR
jgi:hypothetical protein